MGQTVKVTYIGHSGFMAETERSCLLFDYWKGEIPPIPSRKNLYVFSSHVHKDHYVKDIFKLENQCANVYYILSSDIKIGKKDWRAAENVTFVDPHRNISVGGCRIRTLKSTDAGVAFVVKTDGISFYHAGDLHWWEWPGDSVRHNEWLIHNYKKELERLRSESLDISFVVLDPRLEENTDKGMDYFLKTVRSRYVFPMHAWDRYDLIKAYVDKTGSKYLLGQLMDIRQRGQSFLLSV